MTLRTLNYGNYGIFLIIMQDFVHQPYDSDLLMTFDIAL